VFLDQNTRGERIGRIAIKDWHGSLQNDRSSVEFSSHEMDSGTADPDAMFDSLSLGLETGEGRQQRGMDIQHSVRERPRSPTRRPPPPRS